MFSGMLSLLIIWITMTYNDAVPLY
jgi:hypothetical protein